MSECEFDNQKMMRPSGTPMAAPVVSGASSTSFNRSRVITRGRTYAARRQLITTYQGVYGLGVIYGGVVICGGGTLPSSGAFAADRLTRGGYASQLPVLIDGERP